MPTTRSRPTLSSTPALLRLLGVSALLVGGFLRLAYLGQQVVGGDEVHVLKAMRGASFLDVVSRYHVNDHCIPITAWCWLLQASVGLEEWGMRLWSWLPGLLLIWWLPWVTRRLFRAEDRVLLTSLLALSPLLVFWSRQARPYAAIALLGAYGVFAVHRFAVGHGLRGLVGAAAASFALFALSPTTAPFLLTLGLCAVLWGAMKDPTPDSDSNQPAPGARVRTALRALTPQLLAALLVALTLGPALPSLFESQSTREVFSTRVHSATLLHTLRLLFGLAQVAPGEPLAHLVLPPFMLALWGAVRLSVRFPAARIGTLVLLLPPLAYAFSGLHMIGLGVVYLRYEAAVVPVCLALTVYGFADLRERVASRFGRLVGSSITALAFAVIVFSAASGPLTASLPPRTPFGLLYSPLFQGEPLSARLREDQVSELYRVLEESSPTQVVEWPGASSEEPLYAFYREFHRAPILRTFPFRSRGPESVPSATRFRSFAWDIERAVERAAGGAVLVLHKQPSAEKVQLQKGRVRKRFKQRLPGVETAAATCRALLGEPFFEDEWVVAFRKP